MPYPLNANIVTVVKICINKFGLLARNVHLVSKIYNFYEFDVKIFLIIDQNYENVKYINMRSYHLY